MVFSLGGPVAPPHKILLANPTYGSFFAKVYLSGAYMGICIQPNCIHLLSFVVMIHLSNPMPLVGYHFYLTRYI